MRLVTPESGQTLHLVRLEELRPEKGSVFPPDLIEGITQRYRFAHKPQDVADASANGYKFSIGQLRTSHRNVFINKLDIFGDGIVCVASDTTGSDMVVDDLIQWAKVTFNLSDPLTATKRTYSSTVIVEFDRSIDGIISGFSSIVSSISAAYKEQSGYEGDLFVWRMSFMADPQLGAAASPTQFVLERRAGVAADRNRYFSAAPLPTHRHLRLLQTIEALVPAPA